MSIVVDASVAVRWSIPLDRSDRANDLLASREGLIAPDLVLPELTNAAWKYVVFGGGPAEVVQEMIRHADQAFDELVPSIALKDRAFEIALDLRHAAYDCFYIALAVERRVPLITADNRLFRRCAGTRFESLLKAL